MTSGTSGYESAFPSVFQRISVRAQNHEDQSMTPHPCQWPASTGGLFERRWPFKSYGEFIHLQIPENGAHGNWQAPVKGSKLSGREIDRQTRILADAKHHLAMLSEQNVRQPVAKDGGRSRRICYDRSA